MSYTNGVTSSPLLQTLLTQADAAGPSRGLRTSAPGTQATQDSAQLSTAASVLQTTVEDPVRAEKVSSVQAAIANGTYTVSAEAVADKLVQSLLQR